MDDIYLTEGETVALIEASGPRRAALRLNLGSNLLPDVPGNEWAREFILDRRWQTVSATTLAMRLQESQCR